MIQGGVDESWTETDALQVIILGEYLFVGLLAPQAL